MGKAIKNFRAGMSSQDEIDVTPEAEKPDAVTDGAQDSLEPGKQKTES